jgi:hypothetical protein
MKLLKLLFFFILALSISAQAQTRRYFDEVFTDVTVTANVVYGVNATVLALQQAGQAIPQPLRMNVYTPVGDTETARPLVIILHSGNFLPPSVNGGCSGTNADADNVEIATRLAKRGYVVAVATYRLGWNPIASTQTERVFTLINAAYRGVQDSRTCVRFFRANHAANNQFGIDPEKITVFGIGTGGYIAAASATLDTVTDTYIPKFLTAAGPMVIEPVNGNVDGTNVGVTFPGYPGFPVGDTLCYPNHVGVSSRFALAVNLGGALGDASWIDAGDVPMVSFHAPSDPFAPCGIGIVNVPPPVNLPVVEVIGSCGFQPLMNGLGINAAMVNANLVDPISDYARAQNGNIEGFFPFLRPVADASPWGFASGPNPYNLATSPNCETFAAENDLAIDTIISYFLPRACAVLGLSNDCQLVSSVNDVKNLTGLAVVPNPADQDFSLQVKGDYMMQNIEIVDISGRTVARFEGVNAPQYVVRRNTLQPGVYFARVFFKEGVAVQKVVLR